MKKMNLHSVLILILSGLLVSGTGCHLILPLAPHTESVEDCYFCSAQIYRSIPNSTVEFTEEWEFYTWAANSSNAYTDCTQKIGKYINDYMAPGFTWHYRNLTASVVQKEKAVDCTDPLPPPTYGAPFGVELVWNYPPATQAYVYITLVDKDGIPRMAEPAVANACADFAERTGLPNLSAGGTYVLGKRHVRFSDLYLELHVPFQLGPDLTINKFYIQSIGTIIGEDAGANLYKIYPGNAKFFLYAEGQKNGEEGTTSLCFINDITASITEYQGPPNAFFTLSLNLYMDMGTAYDMNVKVSLSKPAAPFSFKNHQPYLAISNKTETSPVDLTPDLAFDHDGNLDKYLWFENFEASNEKFLGQGNPLYAIPFTNGDHQITVVAYDTYGSYNSATMTLTIVNSVPSEVWVDDDFTPGSSGGHTWGVDAFDNIQDGIDAVASPGIVHVAGGYYVDNINMKSGVQILGAGSAFTTIDGGGNGSVVYARWVYSGARLAGVRIINGSWTWGGGIHVHESSDLTIANCDITGNAGTYGGGLYVYDSGVTVANSTIWHNTAEDGAGMLCVDVSSSTTIVNCTFWGNAADSSGGGIYNSDSSPTVTNCIIWGNLAGGSVGNEIYDYGTSSPNVTYCDVDGGYTGLANIDRDPAFLNLDGGNFRLRNGSPCIDAGTNAAVPFWLSHDLGGQTRIMDGDDDGNAIVDMGAYEAEYTDPCMVCVDDDWAGLPPGNLVVCRDCYTGLERPVVIGYDAFAAIQDGIGAVGDYCTVCVAEGRYVENITITGNRNIEGAGPRITIIDGTNSGPVVTNNGNNGIFRGFALVNGESGFGGGMYNSGSSIYVLNCIFRANRANMGGGMANDASSPHVESCLFARNLAFSSEGGGIYNDGSSSPDLINCTFSLNEAATSGGGIYNSVGSSPVIANSILWANGPGEMDGGSPTVNFSDIRGSGGHGTNIDEDPLFVNPEGDFHLLPESPCIDAGNNSYVMFPTEVDGDERILDGDGDGTITVDMGADEYVPTINQCEGDFDTDGDVDGSDLAVFAADFGRTNCGSGPPCEGDFDEDGDVDGSDLAVFAADFGRTDCPY